MPDAQETIKVTLEVLPFDGESPEEAVADAMERAVPGCNPITVGAAYVGFSLDGWYYSVETPRDISILFPVAWNGGRMEPATAIVEFRRGENLTEELRELDDEINRMLPLEEGIEF